VVWQEKGCLTGRNAPDIYVETRRSYLASVGGIFVDKQWTEEPRTYLFWPELGTRFHLECAPNLVSQNTDTSTAPRPPSAGCRALLRHLYFGVCMSCRAKTRSVWPMSQADFRFRLARDNARENLTVRSGVSHSFVSYWFASTWQTCTVN
jgi:hypothetical protein